MASDLHAQVSLSRDTDEEDKRNQRSSSSGSPIICVENPYGRLRIFFLSLCSVFASFLQLSLLLIVILFYYS